MPLLLLFATNAALANQQQAANTDSYLQPGPSDMGYTGVLSVPVAVGLDSRQALAQTSANGTGAGPDFAGPDRRLALSHSFVEHVELGLRIHYLDMGLLAKLHHTWRPAPQSTWPPLRHLRLGTAVGMHDLAGGRVTERFGYAAFSAEWPHVRLGTGLVAHQTSELRNPQRFYSFEFEPIAKRVRLVATWQDSVELGALVQAGPWKSAPAFAPYAQIKANAQLNNPVLTIGNRFSFDEPQFLPTTSAKAAQTTSDSTQFVHLLYEPRPALFDVVAVEEGLYHYQLSVDHTLLLQEAGPLSAAVQVRQPLHHSQELEQGRALARYREDATTLRQVSATYSLQMLPQVANWQQEVTIGNFEGWYYWRAATGDQTKSGYQTQANFAWFEHYGRKEHRWVWLPSVNLPLTFIGQPTNTGYGQPTYSFQLFGGEFWNQDRGMGVALHRQLLFAGMPLRTTLRATRTTQVQSSKSPTNTLVGAEICMDLRFTKPLRLARNRLQANLPARVPYGLRTRLITPGSPNSVHPEAARGPDWVLPSPYSQDLP